jgi:ubiquinone/menaquinone biosynthesis C-methylase UbiE
MVYNKPMNTVKNSRVPLEEAQFTRDEAAAFYNAHARRFMGPIYRRLAARTAALKSGGNRVLDIGTGSGLLAIELAKARPDWRITGIDIAEDMLKLARQNTEKAGLSGKIEFLQAPAAELPFGDGSYDIVASNASLHLWKDPVKVFTEIARVIAPGGACLVWDNLRLPVFYPLLGLIGAVMGMSKAQRRLWLKAVRSSYTAAEVKAVRKKTGLKNAHVTINPWLLELSIGWQQV